MSFRASFRTLCFVALACGLGCGSTTPAPASHAPLQEPVAEIRDVLLITVDTLRADHLGLYGYTRPTSPNIDRWFEDTRVYQRAYATEAATAPSVASILTGRLPQHHGVRLFFQLLASDVPTLPELLGEAGFQTAGVVSNGVLTDEAMGLASRFESYDDFVDEREPTRKVWQRNARRTSDAAISWLEQRRDPERKSFLWVHYMDPHAPYRAPDDRPRNFEHATPARLERDKLLPQFVLPGVDDALEYVDRYDEEIAYCDREIGRLLDHYEAMGLAANALILFTADHGETMAEHEIWFSHQYHVYEAIARVPLAIRFPFPAGSRQPARIQHPVSLVDLLPTVLDALGLAPPAGLDGESLLAGNARSESRDVFVEASSIRGAIQRRALIRNDSKFVFAVGVERGRVGVRYRYDLARDPAELQRLAWDASVDDAQAASLAELVAADPDPGGVPREYARGKRLEHPKVRPGTDPKQLEMLRALGYVE